MRAACRPETLPKRFWKKVRKESETGCWVWIGAIGKRNGYGVIGAGPRIARAHRVSWELHFGPIPDGLHVLHTCDRPECVAPHHLLLGTHTQNMLDKEAKNRGNQPIGARNASTKITENIVRAIRASNETDRTLAGRYGLNPSSISHIRTRRTWRHVT